jgi:hypothetical protein
MKELVYDVEGDALLDDMKHVWCIVIGDPETGESSLTTTRTTGVLPSKRRSTDCARRA